MLKPWQRCGGKLEPRCVRAFYRKAELLREIQRATDCIEERKAPGGSLSMQRLMTLLWPLFILYCIEMVTSEIEESSDISARVF